MSSHIKYHAGDSICVLGSEFTDISYIINQAIESHYSKKYTFENLEIVDVIKNQLIISKDGEESCYK